MIHFLHGIRTGIHTEVKGLIPFLVDAGFEVAYPDYGYELALETRFINPMIVGSILPYIKPGDILIGHSNGCALAYDLLQAGAPATRAVFINAALDTHLAIPKQLKSLDVYFNPGDTITEAAAIAERLGWVDRVWGEMGHAGYQGSDGRVNSFNCGPFAQPQMPPVSGHSDIFTPDKLKAWGPFITAKLRWPNGRL
jgi:hypothetical protein